jgi:SAM-dependent methyltransferase
MDLIRRSGVLTSGQIIDIGSGATSLLPALLDAGYRNLTALDISESALEVSRNQLGDRASLVNWVAADVRSAPLPAATYDLWHDRAVFHFLTDPLDRDAYVSTLRQTLKLGATVIIATFAEDGPEQCSGLTVMRYRADTLSTALGDDFTLIEDVHEAHRTPWDSVQQFIHCRFQFTDDEVNR